MKSAFVLSLVLGLCAFPGRADSLYEQSVQKAVNQRFNSPDVSYLLIDVQNKHVIAIRWPDFSIILVRELSFWVILN